MAGARRLVLRRRRVVGARATTSGFLLEVVSGIVIVLVAARRTRTYIMGTRSSTPGVRTDTGWTVRRHSMGADAAAAAANWDMMRSSRHGFARLLAVEATKLYRPVLGIGPDMLAQSLHRRSGWLTKSSVLAAEWLARKLGHVSVGCMLGMQEFVLGVSAKLWGPTSLSQIRAVHVAMALANADSQPVTLEMLLASLLRPGAIGILRALECLRGSTADC